MTPPGNPRVLSLRYTIPAVERVIDFQTKAILALPGESGGQKILKSPDLYFFTLLRHNPANLLGLVFLKSNRLGNLLYRSALYWGRLSRGTGRR